VTAFATVMGLFPYDPKIDSALGHSHLILAYCVVWAVQLGYLGYVAIKRRAASKTD
jgi:recombinational DNA repair protein RecT